MSIPFSQGLGTPLVFRKTPERVEKSFLTAKHAKVREKDIFDLPMVGRNHFRQEPGFATIRAIRDQKSNG